jgi:hypothetical protein
MLLSLLTNITQKKMQETNTLAYFAVIDEEKKFKNVDLSSPFVGQKMIVIGGRNVDPWPNGTHIIKPFSLLSLWHDKQPFLH